MKLLVCKLCGGEVNIIANEFAVHKKIKCTRCGFSNLESEKQIEVVISRRRKVEEER